MSPTCHQPVANINAILQFFKMGEWVDVVIDDQLPLRRRAAPSETDEWWVPLTEKAYAKFCGSYDRIVGGNTCWAMTDLTGGITVEMKNLNAENADMIKEQEQFSFARIPYTVYDIQYNTV